MNEFDDPELERMLGRASGAYADANVAYEAVRGRVRQVKRRRAIMASTAACALLFGVGALAVRGGEPDANLSPAHGLDDNDITTAETSAVTEASAVDTTIGSDSSDTVDSIGTGETGSSTDPSTHQSAGRGSANGGSGNHPTATVNPTSPNTLVTTFWSKGGSVQVQVVNDKMVLVAEVPLPGYTAHNGDSGGDRIRVEFTDGQHSYEIQLELSDGKIRQSNQNKG